MQTVVKSLTSFWQLFPDHGHPEVMGQDGLPALLPEEALFLPWSVSMSSDAPYWRPPTPRGQYGGAVGRMVSKPVSANFRIARLSGSSSLFQLCLPGSVESISFIMR